MSTKLYTLIKRNVEEGKIGVVIQAGGNGTRLGEDKPKPIVDLGNGETCLSKILSAIPEKAKIFLHVQKEQEEVYKEYINEHVSHPFVYKLFQDKGYVYSPEGKVRTIDGNPVKVANGPGSFGVGLKEMVERLNLGIDYFFVYDGCKLGLHLDDITFGVEKMILEEKKVLTYTTFLNSFKLKEDVELKRRQLAGEDCYPRYDRVFENEIVEKIKMSEEITARADVPAITGLNIFFYPAFVRRMPNMNGRKIEVKNYCGIPGSSYYYDFRIADAVNGHFKEERLFVEQDKGNCIRSIKTPEDLENYRRRRI
ncbi:hypothetical protein GOV06_00375 [Candidatus Woesearchaeota archaeon]|nr:hypothetical protein [Candidatus Woesearchaeota archaeon]